MSVKSEIAALQAEMNRDSAENSGLKQQEAAHRGEGFAVPRHFNRADTATVKPGTKKV